MKKRQYQINFYRQLLLIKDGVFDYVKMHDFPADVI